MNKKAKYTTLKSIVISLAIFALAFIISYEDVKQIWVPVGELDIISR